MYDVRISAEFPGLIPLRVIENNPTDEHWYGYITPLTTSDNHTHSINPMNKNGFPPSSSSLIDLTIDYEREYYIECSYSDQTIEQQKGTHLTPVIPSPHQPPSIHQPKFISLRIDQSLYNLLTHHTHTHHDTSHYIHLLQERVYHSKSLYEFLVELQELIQRLHQQKHKNQLLIQHPPRKDIHAQHHDTSFTTSTLYREVIKNLHQIGWQRIITIDPSLQHIEIGITDQLNFMHRLNVTIPTDYPKSVPIINADLPVHPAASIPQAKTQSISSTKKQSMKSSIPYPPPPLRQHQTHGKQHNASKLSDLVKQYEKLIVELHDFWLNMLDLDEHTWVLEPSSSASGSGGGWNKSATYRRIAIDRGISIHITIPDVYHPRAICSIQVLGNEQQIADLKNKRDKNASKWNTNRMLRENIQELLELHEFPRPPSASGVMCDDLLMECAVCYTYDLEGELPDIVCENMKCARAYHHSCLAEWMKGLTTTRITFNTIFGECVNCSAPLSIPMEHQSKTTSTI